MAVLAIPTSPPGCDGSDRRDLRLLRTSRLPAFGCANFFTPVEGLVIEKPVVTIGEPGDYGYVNENGDVYPGRDFGSYTGTLPYPETLFAPYTSAAAISGSSGGEGQPSPLARLTPRPPLARCRRRARCLPPTASSQQCKAPVVHSESKKSQTLRRMVSGESRSPGCFPVARPRGPVFTPVT